MKGGAGMTDIRNLGWATLAAAGLLLVATAPAWAGSTELVSVTSTGGGGEWPTISADGRYVGFPSDSDNLVPGDTTRGTDVFVRDRQAGTTELVLPIGTLRGVKPT